MLWAMPPNPSNFSVFLFFLCFLLLLRAGSIYRVYSSDFGRGGGGDGRRRRFLLSPTSRISSNRALILVRVFRGGCFTEICCSELASFFGMLHPVILSQA
jgi:hypothetical protein